MQDSQDLLKLCAFSLSQHGKILQGLISTAAPKSRLSCRAHCLLCNSFSNAASGQCENRARKRSSLHPCSLPSSGEPNVQDLQLKIPADTPVHTFPHHRSASFSCFFIVPQFQLFPPCAISRQDNSVLFCHPQHWILCGKVHFMSCLDRLLSRLLILHLCHPANGNTFKMTTV